MVDIKKVYSKKYKNGYGLLFPDGHIIRIYKHIIEYELNKHQGNLLDYGCGNGVHSKTISLIGKGRWIPHGYDVSPDAIKEAKKNNLKYHRNFIYSKEIIPNLDIIYKKKFDLIICNQVLYYLDDKDLNNIVQKFHSSLNHGGIFYASMMDKKNFYYKKSKPSKNKSLRKVVLNGRIKENKLINFKTKSQMLKDFKIFSKVNCGYYDSVIREDEGSTKHIFFIGTKL